jgi:hypothetical protein
MAQDSPLEEITELPRFSPQANMDYSMTRLRVSYLYESHDHITIAGNLLGSVPAVPSFFALVLQSQNRKAVEKPHPSAKNAKG